MIKPRGNQVIVQRELQNVVGGIALADKARKNISLTVVAMGPDVNKDCDEPLKIGDQILCVPTDCMFFIGFMGVDEILGVIDADKIKAVI